MTDPTANLILDIDLERGMQPISKVAPALAALIKRSRSTGQSIIVTQKGYPSGALLGIKQLIALIKLAGVEQKVDLENGVKPISYTSSHLAALLEQSRVTGMPIIVTQKGYPSGALLAIELYNAYVAAAQLELADEATDDNEVTE